MSLKPTNLAVPILFCNMLTFVPHHLCEAMRLYIVCVILAVLPWNRRTSARGRFLGWWGARRGNPLSGAAPFCTTATFCLLPDSVLLKALLCIPCFLHMSGRQPKRARGWAVGQARADVVMRLLSVRDLALEKLKSALTIFLFVPPFIHDAIESAWKDKAEPNKAHPDNCSCGTARLKALLEGIDAALNVYPFVLQASDDTKAGLLQLVQVVGSGRADMVMSDMILRTARPAAEPFRDHFG